MTKPPVSRKELCEIIDEACSALKRALAHPDCAGRQGGVLCVAREDGSTILLVHLGDVQDAKKRAKYEYCAKEKCERLSWDARARTSFASRAPLQERWGGGIRTPHALLSFSGLPEKMDEALVLSVATLLGYITIAEAELLAKESANEYLNAVIFPRDW